MLQKGDKVGIVCCSNGQKQANQNKIEQLNETLLSIGLRPVLSLFIYEKEYVAAGTAKERADSLMDFYKDEEVKAIFDISGGDIANEILPYLDFDVIAGAGKVFWGYSDLTTVINAIYAKTQKASVLYQVRNMICHENAIGKFMQAVFAEKQKEEFAYSVEEDIGGLFDFPYHFVRGTELDGIVVGGNIRCLLKLAGTEYFPDMTDKILLLEALSGEVPQMVTYFSQLQQMGVFARVKGVLLGTFTKYQENSGNLPIEELIKQYVPEYLPLVKTEFVGHGIDSKAVRIGERLRLKIRAGYETGKWSEK